MPLLPLPLLPLLPLPLFPLPLLPLTLRPLPVAPPPLPLPLPLPLPPALPELPAFELELPPEPLGGPAVAAAAAAIEAPKLFAAELSAALLDAAVAVLAFASPQTVAASEPRRDVAIAAELWASPLVTLWTFSLTSPSELEIRTAPER